VDLLARFNQQCLRDFLVERCVHCQGVITLDVVALLALDRQMVVGLDAGDPLIVDICVLVVLDVPGSIVLNCYVQVFLTVDVNLFLGAGWWHGRSDR